jgi:hypothetical protein
LPTADRIAARTDGFPLGFAAGVFTVLFIALAWPWLSGAVTIPWDAKSQFQPQLQFLAASLAGSDWPFWAPGVFAGWPQIADPQSLIFSPLHLLLAATDPRPSFRAADAVTFAALFLGGIGVILLFRERGWHVGGALVAALCFTFGGAAASRLQHTGEILSLAYLPLALWLLVRALDRSSRLTGVAAGIAAGLVATGRDQVALIELYLLAAIVIAYWLGSERRLDRLRASIVPLAAAALSATVIAALPVTMTALLTADSNRTSIDYISAGRGSLHPAHALTLAFADLYGAADPNAEYWGPASYAFGPTGLFLAQNMGQLYGGALPLVAILGVGLARGVAWSRDVRVFTIAAVVVFLYGLGWYTPVFRLIYELVPGVNLFRRPADAAFVLGALLAVLAGYSIHRWLSATVAPATWRARALEIALAVAVVAAAGGLAFDRGRLNVALVPIVTGVIFAGAAAALLVLTRKFAQRTLSAAFILAAFAAADLAWNNAPNGSTGLSPSMYDVLRPRTANATIALLKQRLANAAAPDRRDRVELSAIGYHWANASLVHGFDGLFGQNPLRLKEFARATGVGDIVATPDQRTFSPLFPSYRSAFADVLGLRLIATGVPIEHIDSSLQSGDLDFVGRTPDAYVYENPRALPRAMVVTSWRLADFGDCIRSGWPPQVDPTHTVLLERPPPISAGTLAATPNGRVRIIQYDNTRVTIDVDAPAGGLLVLNDVWHPWWRASLDGAATTILRANVLFRAVALPPGHHQVRFEFHPVAGAAAELAAKLGLGR